MKTKQFSRNNEQLSVSNVKQSQRMSNKQRLQRKIIDLCFLLFTLLTLLFISCDFEDSTSSSNRKYIETDLRASWECNIADFWPEGQTVTTERGKLVFDLNTVVISGPIKHLKGFTRDIKLEAYTEDGGIYIKDKGVWQKPVAYLKWESGGSYPKDKMLTLQGDIPDETLKRTSQ